MAVINNINRNYNIDTKKVSSKLSFQTGEVFSARVTSQNERNMEILLKLLDGWQFTAKLLNPLEFIPNGLVKFQVLGFEDGKLQIKVANAKEDNEEKENSSLESAIKGQNLDVDKEDYVLLKSMIKHNMPLTKENITHVKTLVDFKDKINYDDDEENKFINRYIESKNIPLNSEKANEITNTLKGFFKELKNLDTEDILTLLENNIEPTEENIKSFNKIFKGENTIYKDLKNMEESFSKSNNSTETNNLPEKQNSNIKGDNLKNGEVTVRGNNAFTVSAKDLEVNDLKESLDKFIDKENVKTDTKNINVDNTSKQASTETSNEEKIEVKHENKKVNEDTNLNKTEGKVENNADNNINKQESLKENKLGAARETESVKLIKAKEILNSLKGEYQGKLSEKDINEIEKLLKTINDAGGKEEKFISILKEQKDTEAKLSKLITEFIDRDNSNNDTVKLLKEQISFKNHEIKDIVRNLMTEKDKLEPEVFNKVLQGLRENLNDFKVFNSVSNQYYYMDLPVNIRQDRYQCKLIIKDDRKSGKQIDSKNIKLVVSVKTNNLGTVDAYIKVSHNNMNVDIKCEQEWVKILSLAKEKMLKDISNLGYNVHVNVDKKAQEINITNCREFFEDNNLGSINIKV